MPVHAAPPLDVHTTPAGLNGHQSSLCLQSKRHALCKEFWQDVDVGGQRMLPILVQSKNSADTVMTHVNTQKPQNI